MKWLVVKLLGDPVKYTGHTSDELVELENIAQQSVAENPEWLLARELLHVGSTMRRGQDSREELEHLGFEVLGEKDDLFYRVQQPEGWSKTTSGYWTSVTDEQGIERITQFYKGAIYDRRAFLNIVE